MTIPNFDKLSNLVYKTRLTIGYPDMSNEEIKAYNERRDALFRNPTLEAAMAILAEIGVTKFDREDVPLATVHKARLQWLEATDEMLEESKAWLLHHGYQNTFNGAPPLTPEARDADRVSLGKKPLGEE
jgi:hypothetical protein